MPNRAIYFDMDGTIADLYGVADWLPKLRSENPTPYEEAKPLLRMQSLARALNTLHKKGYHIGVISWGSMGSSETYLAETETAKREWLKAHLRSVEFDEIIITHYGIPKSSLAQYPNGILFDDNEQIREEWRGRAYPPDTILDILRALV